MIEANEVIDVRMRDKHVGELKDLFYAETVDAAEIEEHSPPFIVKADEKDRILERTIDEASRESIGHSLWSTTPGSLPQGY